MPFGGGGFGGGGFGGGGGSGGSSAIELFALRSGHALFCKKARGATHIQGAALSQLLSIGTLFVQFGSLHLDCIAIRTGAHYEVPASAFEFVSQDGTFITVNEIAFTGGQLTPSGIGPGTLITPIPNVDPLPTNLFVLDTPVSG